jgi:hypothetical protein
MFGSGVRHLNQQTPPLYNVMKHSESLTGTFEDEAECAKTRMCALRDLSVEKLKV